MPMLRCPCCQAETDSLKVYRAPTFMLFIVVAYSVRSGTLVGCPTCMRKELGRLALINVLPANVFWLFLLAPWYQILALRSYTAGHSRDAEQHALPAGAAGYRSGGPALPPGHDPAKPWRSEPSLQGAFRDAANDVLDVVFVLPSRSVERLPVQLIRPDGACYRGTLMRSSPSEPGLHAGLEVFVRPSSSHPPVVWVPPAAAANLQDWVAACGSCGFDLAYEPAATIGARIGAAPGAPRTGPCPACGAPQTLTFKAPEMAFGAPVTEADKSYAPGLGNTARLMWTVAMFGAIFLGALIILMTAALGSESDGVAMTYLMCLPVGAALGGRWALGFARARNKPAWFTAVGAVLGAVFLGFITVFFFEAIFPAL